MPETNFCTSGQKARVTIGGQFIGEYENTPITVECLETRSIRISWSVTYYNSINQRFTSTANDNRWGPFLGWTITNNNRTFNFICRTSPTGPITEQARFTAGPLGIISVNFVNVTNTGNIISTGGLRIKDVYGSTLYTDINAACNDYLVECISNCPPNALDCGNCCLDCKDTINKISSIRNIIKTL